MAKSAVRLAETGEDVPNEGQETEAFVRNAKLNIYQRMNMVMSECGHIEKTAVHEIRRDGKKLGEFKYITHDEVTAHIRKAFIKYGIAVRTSVGECAKDGNRIEMRVDVAFVNIDDPEDQITVESVGHGIDFSDKAPGKAFSYAVKYAYMKMLMLNSAEDIETSDIEHEPAAKTDRQIDEEVNKEVAEQQTHAELLRLAIGAAKDVAEVNRLQKINTHFLMNVPDTTRDYFINMIETRKAKLEGENVKPE